MRTLPELITRLEQHYTFTDEKGHSLAMCRDWIDLKAQIAALEKKVAKSKS